MSHPYWKKDLPLPPKADIVVLGGGFVGLSVAYWLKIKKPQLDICVLDRAPLGEGASGRNAGFLTKGSLSFYQHLTRHWGATAAQDIYSFADESIQLLLEHFPLKESIKTSSYTLYEKVVDFEFMGFKKVPSPISKLAASYECQGEASINPMLLLTELEQKVCTLGVKVYRGVEGLKLTNKKVETNFGDVGAGEVVIALNGYTQELLPELITPQRAQMLCAQLKEAFNLPFLFYGADSRVYFKALGNKKIIIGGKRLVDPLTEETSQLGINQLIQANLEDFITQKIGAIEVIEARWSGIMGFSSDELPVIEKKENYYLITGFSGHGMGLGFNAARNLSDMLLENQSSFFHSIRTTHCRVNKG